MSDTARLSELFQRWQALRERGQDADPAKLCRDCPDLLPELRQRIQRTRDLRSPQRARQKPAFVYGTPARHTEEVQLLLLRVRLRAAGLIMLGVYLLVVISSHFDPVNRGPMDWLDFLSYYLAIGPTAVAVAFLFGRRQVTLRWLRGLEIGLFGLAAVLLAWQQYRTHGAGQFMNVARAGQEPEHALMLGDSLSIYWLALITLYGTYIPNTWRRCALIVTGLALAPVLVVAELARNNAALRPFLLEHCLPVIATWMAIAAVTAIYGSHKISVLRREMYEARQLGQYRLKRRLGAGGMGEVYLAEHQLLRRPCAVKLIRPESSAHPQSLQRFEREVQAMAGLAHANIAEVYDYGNTADGTFYYVMEFLPGLSLEDLVRRHGRLPPDRVVHILRQVCSALRAAHRTGLIHRDIKPSNMIVGERGGLADVVKLVDFGLVHDSRPDDLSTKLTMEGTILGTPTFMSPEQAAGERMLDGRSDLYSLAATAYFLLTGQPPFERSTTMAVLAAHICEPVTPPADLCADLPADLQAVLLRCLEKDPNRRFPDVDGLDRALAACACAGGWTPERAAAWWQQTRPAAPGKTEMEATQVFAPSK